ncbi:hypothetical protein TrRE_jg11516 [Triparma retinervis]|uniref:Uncharacterized protein n=1 Tax=Triparma retinervis TaxID=2557542 RepID=A0A9W7FAQ2_9STRA|nr:hypothetical protein TrRE_jg11516 [Triparma retinervis]
MPQSTFTQASLPRPRSIQESISEVALNGLAEYRSSYVDRNEHGEPVGGGANPGSHPEPPPGNNDRNQLPRGESSTKPPLSPRHPANSTYESSQPTSPSSSQGMDEADRARYQSIMRASIPEARQPLTPPPPSSTGLRMNNSDISASSSKLNITNQTSIASNNGSIFASVNKSLERRADLPDLRYEELKYEQSSTREKQEKEHRPMEHRPIEHRPIERRPADHRHSTTVTAAATAAATDKLKDEKVERQYYSSRPDVPAFASRSTHDAPGGNHFTYGQSPYSHLYNQQSHEQRLQIHMASISEKYGREFRAVDERIAGYLGRFLRRAKHGPEQERQLLQVLQVEIRDLLRRTLDSEAEVIHLTELLKESHARMQDVTNNSDGHLERILAQHEDRLREQKQKVESDASERVLSMETRFKRERLELEEKLAFAESEMNHKLKTSILECEQKIYERDTENQRAIKQREREMESERDNYKHQLGNLTAELQSEKRSYLELQEAMGKVKQAQATERLQVQQQLVEVVQTWEAESKKREEAVRKEMERGFEMRLAAERDLLEKEREKHIKNLQEGFAIDMGREMTSLSDKYSSHHKGEVATLKQKMAFDYETKLSKQKGDFEEVIRSLKLEVDDALKKIRLKEEDLRRKEADVEVGRVEVDRKREALTEVNNDIKVKEHMSWIEQPSGWDEGSSDDSDTSVSSPFFDDVDARISEILDAKLKKDAVKKASRRESLSLDRQTEETARKQVESIGAMADGMEGVGGHYFPQYSSLLNKQPYSYPPQAPAMYQSEMTGVDETAMGKTWSDRSMAAAWMPRSFYQEYVRTSSKK